MYKSRLCFDTLARLWEEDPARFEAFRKSTINSIFDSVGETVDRHKLEHLQFRIDGIIRRHGTMGALVRLHRLMLDEVVALQECTCYLRVPQRCHTDRAIPDNVLRFPPSKS